MLRFPPKRILVPVDLSERSASAWSQAEALALPFGAELLALHVDEPIGEADWTMPIPLTGHRRRRLIEQVRERLGPLARVRVAQGLALSAIRRAVRLWRADLVVMGTRGRKGLAYAAEGSLAERTAKLSPAPVLVARREPRTIQSILVPMNFEPYSEAGLFYAAGLARELGASLRILHVTADRERCPNPRLRLSLLVRDLPKELRGYCDPRIEVRQGRPLEQILAAAKGYDLVVLTAHRKRSLGELILGTTAERVIRHARPPVLVVPPVLEPSRFLLRGARVSSRPRG